MYAFGNDKEVFDIMKKISKTIDSEVYIPISIIEEINEAFAMVIVERTKSDRDPDDNWAKGALSVMNVFKLMTDGLLDRFAEELVPDTLPDNL